MSLFEGNRNVIRENRVDRSRGAEGGLGIPLARGDHNLIATNSIRDTQAAPISVGFEPGVANVVRGNRIRAAGEAGVLVDSKGKHTLVLGNVIRGAAEDGVLIKSSARQPYSGLTTPSARRTTASTSTVRRRR